MSTRSIVTSQPDVACDVCERRLLRGEQPDTFLAAGEPRIVCELCAPRAAHQGWKRGSAVHQVGEAPLRNGRRRALFGRLRQARRTEGEASAAGPYGRTADPYDFLGGTSEDGASPVGEDAGAAPGGDDGYGAGEVLEQRRSGPVRYDGPLQQAVDVFNTGEYPRRVASLTRSLGAPEVTVRAGEAVASSVVIVLAWELCWYTYEVDLDDLQGLQARAIAQGTELSELGPEDRLGNGLADERGALALI
ncbi:MAG TPA: hypothetical protein VIH49_03825 [Solirubrobacteraceae bacterium]